MKKRMHGFTLLELMVVLVLAGIILGLGIPAMGDFIRNARITAAANDVMAALHFARSEAIKRRAPVTVCTSTNALDVEPDCAASPTLAGWIVFVDDNGNGQRDEESFDDVNNNGVQDTVDEDTNGDGILDPGEDLDGDGALDLPEPSLPVEQIILTQHAPLPGTLSARGSDDPLAITYLDTGFTASATAGQLVICDARGNVPSGGQLSAARAIAVSATGRASVSRDLAAIQALIDALNVTVAGCTPS
jgi:type IV fimbrial biogenesis protein FimT